MEVIPVAVVDNQYYQEDKILKEVISSLSKENENRILGNIFEFTYDEDIDVEDDSDTEDDFDELFEEVMSDIEKRLERAKNADILITNIITVLRPIHNKTSYNKIKFPGI